MQLRERRHNLRKDLGNNIFSSQSWHLIITLCVRTIFYVQQHHCNMVEAEPENESCIY